MLLCIAHPPARSHASPDFFQPGVCVQATGTRRLIGVLAFSGPSILVIEQIVTNISRFRIYLFEEARILRGLFKKHILYGVCYLLILAAVHPKVPVRPLIVSHPLLPLHFDVLPRKEKYEAYYLCCILWLTVPCRRTTRA